MRLAAASALLCTALPLQAAVAQQITGLYVGAAAGPSFLQDQPVRDTILQGVSTQQDRSTSFKTGLAAIGSIGWGFGNGLRVELEGTYRQAGISAIRGAASSGGDEIKDGGMLNVAYDFDFGWPISPYIGVGVGEQTIAWRNGRATNPNSFIRLQHEDPNFAYQAFVGASYQLPVPGLALTADYRFLGSSGHTVYGQWFAPGLDKPAEMHLRDDFEHSVLIGLRYAFNAAPPPASAPSAPPVASANRTYLVFFDWDRADLNDRARQVIGEAARQASQRQLVHIALEGHTDRSGTPAYNQGLSLRRARAVGTELVANGVPAGAIAVRGLGETRPLVPTADGAREPQNRRVEIVMR